MSEINGGGGLFSGGLIFGGAYYWNFTILLQLDTFYWFCSHLALLNNLRSLARGISLVLDELFKGSSSGYFLDTSCF